MISRTLSSLMVTALMITTAAHAMEKNGQASTRTIVDAKHVQTNKTVATTISAADEKAIVAQFGEADIQRIMDTCNLTREQFFQMQIQARAQKAALEASFGAKSTTTSLKVDTSDRGTASAPHSPRHADADHSPACSDAGRSRAASDAAPTPAHSDPSSPVRGSSSTPHANNHNAARNQAMPEPNPSPLPSKAESTRLTRGWTAAACSSCAAAATATRTQKQQ